MVATNSQPSRAVIATLATAIVAVAVTGGVAAYVKGTKAKPVTVNQAVKRFRQDTQRTPTPRPPPTKTHPTAPTTPIPAVTATVNVPASPTQPSEATSGTAGTTGTTTTAAPTTSATTAPSATAPATTSPAPTATATTAPSTPVTLSPTGVYRYATTGGEHISLPGGKRSFPATTAVTVEKQGCGESIAWQPLNQHTETQVLCLTNHGVRLASYQTKVAFFGVDSSEDYVCPSKATVYAPDTKLGDSWSFTCKSSDATISQVLTAVGYRTFDVGGTKVRTLHIHVDAALKGADSGTSAQDYWLATSDTLLVRNTGSVDATQTGVHYQEHFALQLDSVHPRT